MVDERTSIPTINAFEGRAAIVSRFLQMKKNIEVGVSENGSEAKVTFDTENPIGAGDSSIVFVGEMQGSKVAVKVYHPLTTFSEKLGSKLKNEFEEEGELLAKCEHPNIGKIFGRGSVTIGSQTQIPVVVREYFPSTLKVEIESDKRPTSERLEMATRMVEDVASALDYLQREHGLLIQDIDTTNIMLRENKDFVLADLNLAKFEDKDVRIESDYSAPELMKIQTEKPTPQSQVYSLSLIAYEMLGGNLPAREDKLLGDFKLESIEGVPEPVLDILRKASAKNPKDRFPTLSEFASVLKETVGQPAAI